MADSMSRARMIAAGVRRGVRMGRVSCGGGCLWTSLGTVSSSIYVKRRQTRSIKSTPGIARLMWEGRCRQYMPHGTKSASRYLAVYNIPHRLCQVHVGAPELCPKGKGMAVHGGVPRPQPHGHEAKGVLGVHPCPQSRS